MGTGNLSTDVILQLNEVAQIKWVTNKDVYNVTLWQQDVPSSKSTVGKPIYSEAILQLKNGLSDLANRDTLHSQGGTRQGNGRIQLDRRYSVILSFDISSFLPCLGLSQ
jgi:hypothetical protein